jgi:hypothetical protein
MTGPGDEMSTAGRGRPRASHADREQVIDTLKAAFVQGLLTKDELDARVGQAFASRTYAELAAVTTGIPAGPAPAQPLREPARAQARPPENEVTYLNDPVFGRMRPAAGIDPGGNLIADNSGTVEAIPVVLFEPAQIMVMKNKVTGMVQEGKTGASSRLGSTEFPGTRSGQSSRHRAGKCAAGPASWSCATAPGKSGRLAKSRPNPPGCRRRVTGRWLSSTGRSSASAPRQG